MIRATEPTLESIRQKVEAGQRLSFDDGLFLYRPDVSLPDVGELANLVRERKNGNLAYFIINHHINPNHNPNKRFSVWNWILVVLGIPLLILAIIGTFLPN